MSYGSPTRYSSPYYRSAESPTYHKDYYSPSTPDARYSSPHRSDQRDSYSPYRGRDVYSSREHDWPRSITRDPSVATNDLHGMLDQALEGGRGRIPQPPPPPPPSGPPRYRSLSPAALRHPPSRYDGDLYDGSRVDYGPRDDISLHREMRGHYDHRSSIPYRYDDSYGPRGPNPRYDRDHAAYLSRRPSFEREYRSDWNRPDYIDHDRRPPDYNYSSFEYERRRNIDVGADYDYSQRESIYNHRDHRKTGEPMIDNSPRDSYHRHPYGNEGSSLAPPRRPYDDYSVGNHFHGPLPPASVQSGDFMNSSYKSTPKEVTIRNHPDYSIGRETSGRHNFAQSTRSMNSALSVLSTWYGDDIVLLPKGHQVSEAAVAATAAASLIADESTRICGFDTAANRISDFVKPGIGKDALSSVLDAATVASPLRNPSHMPFSYANMQESMKRDLLVTATVNTAREKKMGSLPMDAYQFWSRCTLLVATAILKIGPSNTQIAHAAAETVMLHGIGTIHEDWRLTAEQDLKLVADAVSDVVTNFPGGNENMASIASLALLSEGSRTLAVERVRESESQRDIATHSRLTQARANDPKKPPSGRTNKITPSGSIGGTRNSHTNMHDNDDIQSIRNTGSLMDAHSSNEEDDHESSLNHATSSHFSKAQAGEETRRKNKLLEQKRGEIAERISRIQIRASTDHEMPSVLRRIESSMAPNGYTKRDKIPPVTNNQVKKRMTPTANNDSKRSTNARSGSQSLLGTFLEKFSCSVDQGDYDQDLEIPDNNTNNYVTEEWETMESIAGTSPVGKTVITVPDDGLDNVSTYAPPYPLISDGIRSTYSNAVSNHPKGNKSISRSSSFVDPSPKGKQIDGAFSDAIKNGTSAPTPPIRRLSLTLDKAEDVVENSNDSHENENEPESKECTNEKATNKSRFKMRFGKKRGKSTEKKDK